MNLEIGSGPQSPKTKGWHFLDSRRLPGVTYVQDARDLSNIETDAYEIVYAKDVIEHIGWREIVPTLREWLRVASDTLVIETPNAAELLLIMFDHHLGGGSTVPWPETQYERFNRILFGHQDYPENSHKSYFTPEWLEQLLKEAGATRIETVHKDLTRFKVEASK